MLITELDELWSKTLRMTEATPANFEELAAAVLEVHRSGDPSFAQHVSNRLRSICKERGASTPDTTFDLNTAKLLVADEIGFPDWGSLLAAIVLRDQRPLIFHYAVAAMKRGDFSALESTVGGPDLFHDAIVSWYEKGFFNDEPETLAEIFSAACMLGHERTAAYLLDKGVDPLAGTRTGLNGFHYAASSGRVNVIKLLIERKVPMEVKNMYGGTVWGQALWSAVNEHRDEHAEIIERLLDAGAVTEPGTTEWWRQQNVPSERTRDRVLKALQRHGGP